MKCLSNNLASLLSLAMLAAVAMVIAAPAIADAQWFLQQRRFYGPTGFAYPNARFDRGPTGGVYHSPPKMGNGPMNGAPLKSGPVMSAPVDRAPVMNGPTNNSASFQSTTSSEITDSSNNEVVPYEGALKGPAFGTTLDDVFAREYCPACGDYVNPDDAWVPTPWPKHHFQHMNNVGYPADAVVIKLQMPPSTRLYVNGRETYLTGPNRTLMSRGLSYTGRYRYELRAELDRPGGTITETKIVTSQAGYAIPVVFLFRNRQVVPVQELPPGIPVPNKDETVSDVVTK